MKPSSLTCDFLADQALIPSEQPCERGLELTLTAPPAKNQQRPSLNLALVIDRSGSMAGPKIENARLAASHVLTLLDERDSVHVVAFDNEVNLVGSAEHLTAEARADLTARIAEIQHGGSTNLSGGWLEGCDRIAQSPGRDLKRALLLTDGQANHGITDIEELGTHARELHRRGISTSTFGIGDDYQENLLEQMANLGGGNFYYIESPQVIPDTFTTEMKDILTVTARALEVILPIPPRSAITVIGGWKHEEKDGALRIYLGDLSGGKTRTLHLKALLPPADSAESLPIQATIRALDEDNQVVEIPARLELRYATPEEIEKSAPNKAVAERYAAALVSEAATEALKLEREGLRDEAASHLDMVLGLVAPSLSPEKIHESQVLYQRIQHGLSERERKESHNLNYRGKQSRDRQP